MKTYKEHFLECRQNYNDISENDENYLYNFSLAVIDDDSTWLSLTKNYATCVARIKSDLEKRFTVRNECWYLTDVSESTGAFKVLQNNEGHTVRAETTRIDHETWTATGSRIPEDFLNVLKQQGFTPGKVTGKTGTMCIFDNNIIHKASIPEPGNYRDAIVLMVRPTKEKTRPFIDKNNTGTFYHVDLHVNPEHLGVQKR